MRETIRYLLVFYLLLIIPGIAHSKVPTIGEIDRIFSYENLELDVHTGLFKGKIINKSSEIQKYVRIRVDAFDVFKKLLWQTTIKIDFINPKEGKNFKQVIPGTPLESPLEIKCVNLNAPDETKKRASIEDVQPDDYLNTSSNRLPIFINGNGKKMSDLFELEKGLIKARFEHKGGGHFSIWLKDGNGKGVDLLVNEIGKLSGSSSATIPRKGKYFVDVDADPNATWSLGLEKPSSGDYQILKDENKIQIKKGKDGVTHLELNN